jgi:coenzyme F420-reducing hydrogenase gamma subunit
MSENKLRIGWFSFSCCEDSTIVFTEILNDYYLKWKNKLEICSALVLQKRSRIENIDVSFIEGAITSEVQKEQLLNIRKESKKIVAIGACACNGMPSAQRNLFDDKTNIEIEGFLARFKYAKSVKKISDIVKVDYSIPGCPMDEKLFIDLIENLFIEFGID